MSDRPPVARLPLTGAEDTIAAIATAQGRGALALLRLSGPRAREIATRTLPDWQPTDRHPVLAMLRDPSSGDQVDQVVVTLFEGPRSYTGDDLVEITTHGGALVPVLALHALLAAGARQALPGEFTRRAVAAGKMDVLQAEGVADLVDAQSRAMHQTALRQMDGALSSRIEELRTTILDLEAMIAYEIDFPEEDEGPVAASRVGDAADRVLGSLDGLLGTVRAGELIRRGAVVVIAGAPNVGKSSLFNALLGTSRAIVTDIPGTTRDAIEALVELGDWPVRLVDTAGLRETDNVVERLGIEVSERYLGDADLVLAVADTDAGVVETSRRVRALTRAVVLGVRTKADLVTESSFKGNLVSPRDEMHHVVSARTGSGLDALAEAIATQLGRSYGAHALDTPLLTRERHREAVARAREEVSAFRIAWGDDALPATVAAVHLRAAASALEALIGVVDVEDIFDRVFRSFCIGK